MADRAFRKELCEMLFLGHLCEMLHSQPPCFPESFKQEKRWAKGCGILQNLAQRHDRRLKQLNNRHLA